MTRFWIRNLTSRNDSLTGAWVISRPLGAAGAWLPPPPPGVVAGTLDPSGADPAPGRALSIRFSRDISHTPSAANGHAHAAASSPREQ